MNGTGSARYSRTQAAGCYGVSYCHALPAHDARLPSDSGWCPGLAALPSPSLRFIRAVRDGSALPASRVEPWDIISPLNFIRGEFFLAPKNQKGAIYHV